jgi:hypothetical protein
MPAPPQGVGLALESRASAASVAFVVRPAGSLAPCQAAAGRIGPTPGLLGYLLIRRAAIGRHGRLLGAEPPR